MKKDVFVLIFTDLDGSLLHRTTFKFDEIKSYIKDLISKGICIVPNSSKTDDLPYLISNSNTNPDFRKLM